MFRALIRQQVSEQEGTRRVDACRYTSSETVTDKKKIGPLRCKQNTGALIVSKSLELFAFISVHEWPALAASELQYIFNNH
jgi:hypothetical protein